MSIVAANSEAITFVENTKAEMAIRGWNQSDLARHANISQPRVSEILNSDQDIRLGTCAKIAKAFGLSVSAMLAPRPESAEKIA